MSKHFADWDPRSNEVLIDPLLTSDDMRRRCPVAYSDYLGWSIFRHEDVVNVLEDHHRFSNSVSAHRSVPNSMDPPEHTKYRKIIEPYFSAERMKDFETPCKILAKNLIASLPRESAFDCVSALAQAFAVRVQCSFLGWPADKQNELQYWMEKNQKAVLNSDRAAMSEVAQEFSEMVHQILAIRREKDGADIISRLTKEVIDNRPLAVDEIISILRNWTGGEISTISASIGIIVYFLARHQHLQEQLRQEPEKLAEAIDEILRIHNPLMSNRRITTCPLTMGEKEIEAGERLTLMWVSANRDEKVFADPQEFKWGRDARKNLLYGTGIHVCPGAPLARLELSVIIRELLQQTNKIELAQMLPPEHAFFPAGGYKEIYINIKD